MEQQTRFVVSTQKQQKLTKHIRQWLSRHWTSGDKGQGSLREGTQEKVSRLQHWWGQGGGDSGGAWQSPWGD